MIRLFGGRLTLGKDITGYAGRTDDFYAIMQQKYGSDYKMRNRLNAYHNVVYACVSLIGEACGGYEPKFMRKKGDQLESIDHEFLNLLRRPAGIDQKALSFSMFDLFEATSSYQSLQGDCFWYMARGSITGKPKEIVVLRPDRVGTDINKKTGGINGYFIRRLDGEPIPLDVEEVLQFNLFNPKDPYRGYGTVEAASDYIATDESTAAFTKNFFKNNAGLSGILSIKGEVTKSAFRKFVRAWREKYEGEGNAGKAAIIRDSDAAFQKVGLGLDELNMAELRKMSLEDVMMMFRVPLPLLGKAEQTGLGRGNVEALEYIFAKYNIEAKMRRFDAILKFALERYWGEKDIIVTHENIIPEDKEFELNERNLLVDRVYTRDEVRDEEGLDPVSGGDQLFVPLNQVPIGDAGTLVPSTDTGATKIIRRIVLDPKKKDLVRKEQFRLRLMRNQASYERAFKKKVKPIFRQQRAEAIYNLEAHASNLAKAAKLFDDSIYDALIVKELKPTLTELVRTQGALALLFAGDDQSEFLITRQIESLIAKSTLKMATRFNDETLDRLNKTLAEGIQAGEGIGKLKDRVGSVYDEVEGYRAERIARTETLRESNRATTLAYKQTGYITGKQWSVNPDACPQCEEFDGKTVGLDEAFLALGQSYSVGSGDDEQIYTNDYDTLEEPPLHPNCRCTIIPIR